MPEVNIYIIQSYWNLFCPEGAADINNPIQVSHEYE